MGGAWPRFHLADWLGGRAGGVGTLAGVSARRVNPILLALGPGIVFAGAAIGVSHLVQSTRAGAVYGLSLLWLVVLAHAMKLPAMLFGPRYAAATGHSLLHAYRVQGRHALIAFGVLTVGTMFAIQAAITVVTASLVKGVVVDPLVGAMGLETSIPMPWVALGVMLVCTLPLLAGGYGWLDRCIKVLMVVMAVTTVVAAATQLPAVIGAGLPVVTDLRAIDAAWIVFAVALVGWMPAPLDIAVWHSLWTLARRRQTGHTATRRQCEVDFVVGYTLCVVLAASFVVLGAALLHLRAVEPAGGGPAFAAQLISLYTDAIGAWAGPLIAVGAVAVMLSTSLTVLDALPRSLTELWSVAMHRPTDQPESAELTGRSATHTAVYWTCLVVLIVGAMLLITAFNARMRLLVDLATTLSFVATPVLAFFNHRAITGRDIPAEHRPGRVMRAWSWIAIVFWLAFVGVYAWVSLS